jgi:hypothetical protein
MTPLEGPAHDDLVTRTEQMSDTENGFAFIMPLRQHQSLSSEFQWSGRPVEQT